MNKSPCAHTDNVQAPRQGLVLRLQAPSLAAFLAWLSGLDAGTLTAPVNLSNQEREALLTLGKICILCGRRELGTQATLSHLEQLKRLVDIGLKDLTAEEIGGVVKWAGLHHSVRKLVFFLSHCILTICTTFSCSAGSHLVMRTFLHGVIIRRTHRVRLQLRASLLRALCTGLRTCLPPSDGSTSP